MIKLTNRSEASLGEDVLPRRRGVRPLTARRGFFILAVFLLTQLVVGGIVGFCTSIYHTAIQRLLPITFATQFQQASVVLAAILATAASGAVVLWLTKRSTVTPPADSILAEVGWTKASLRHLAIGAGMGLGLALLYVGGLLQLVPPPARAAWGPLTTAVSAGGWARHLWAAWALVGAPPLEELLFRGVLLTSLARSWGRAPGAVVVTMVFVLMHALEVFQYWPAAFAVTVGGVALVWARLRTGSLFPGMVLHGSYNLGLVLAVYGSAVS